MVCTRTDFVGLDSEQRETAIAIIEHECEQTVILTFIDGDLPYAQPFKHIGVSFFRPQGSAYPFDTNAWYYAAPGYACTEILPRPVNR